MNDKSRRIGSDKSGILSRSWAVTVSPTVFVVLACLWCLDLGIGSIMAFRRDPEFWMKMDSVPFNVWLDKFAPLEMPHSLWVYILVVLTWLVMVSLAACAIGWFAHRRARKRTFAEALVHLGFMLVFVGFIVGSGWGERSQGIVVAAGETADVPGLDIKLSLGSVEVRRDAEGRELETVSNVTLTGPGGDNLVSGTARLNHPLIHGQTVVYPEGGEVRAAGGELEVGGVGRVTLKAGGGFALPDGRVLRVRGLLGEGQRYSRYIGPGAFITIGDAAGREHAGAFFGDLPFFRKNSLDGVELVWVKPVTSAVARFNVHRDPGVQFVLFGAIFLTLGTFWALGSYLRREAA